MTLFPATNIWWVLIFSISFLHLQDPGIQRCRPLKHWRMPRPSVAPDRRGDNGSTCSSLEVRKSPCIQPEVKAEHENTTFSHCAVFFLTLLSVHSSITVDKCLGQPLLMPVPLLMFLIVTWFFPYRAPTLSLVTHFPGSVKHAVFLWLVQHYAAEFDLSRLCLPKCHIQIATHRCPTLQIKDADTKGLEHPSRSLS